MDCKEENFEGKKGGEGEIRERGEQLPFLAARYTPGNPLLAITSSNS